MTVAEVILAYRGKLRQVDSICQSNHSFSWIMKFYFMCLGSYRLWLAQFLWHRFIFSLSSSQFSTFFSRFLKKKLFQQLFEYFKFSLPIYNLARNIMPITLCRMPTTFFYLKWVLILWFFYGETAFVTCSFFLSVQVLGRTVKGLHCFNSAPFQH